MKLTEALRWTIYYRGIALVSFLLGAVLAGVGVWYGFLDLVLSRLPGATGDPSFDTTSVVVGALLILLGVVVWQIGKTAAFYMTITEATESEMADQFDTQTVKSEILEVLDDRLADIHADVESTRQQVDRLGIDEHADELTVHDGVGEAPTGGRSEGPHERPSSGRSNASTDDR